MVFNVVIIIVVLIFANSPFLFILTKSTSPCLFRFSPLAYLILSNVPPPPPLLRLFGTHEYLPANSYCLVILPNFNGSLNILVILAFTRKFFSAKSVKFPLTFTE